MVIEDFLGGAKVPTLEISKAYSLIIKIVKLIKHHQSNKNSQSKNKK